MVYIKRTVAVSADLGAKRELDHFVEVLSAGIVELAARTSCQENAIRFKPVQFIFEIKKATVVDSESSTGGPLDFYEVQESVLRRDLRELSLACGEKRISFGKSSCYCTPGQVQDRILLASNAQSSVLPTTNGS